MPCRPRPTATFTLARPLPCSTKRVAPQRASSIADLWGVGDSRRVSHGGGVFPLLSADAPLISQCAVGRVAAFGLLSVRFSGVAVCSSRRWLCAFGVRRGGSWGAERDCLSDALLGRLALAARGTGTAALTLHRNALDALGVGRSAAFCSASVLVVPFPFTSVVLSRFWAVASDMPAPRAGTCVAAAVRLRLGSAVCVAPAPRGANLLRHFAVFPLAPP